MKKNVKKIIALCICCALLAAAVIQNVYSNKNSDSKPSGITDNNDSSDTLVNNNDSSENEEPAGTDDDSEPTGIKCENTEDYLSGLRLERDRIRSLEAEECMSIIESDEFAEDEKTKAQETVQSIGVMQEIEVSVETALRDKGYEDVFVNYSIDGNIDVTLVAETLVEDEVMAIATVIEESTGVTLDCMSLKSIYA